MVSQFTPSLEIPGDGDNQAHALQLASASSFEQLSANFSIHN